mmetsp:Transcript_64759/g.187701  ORF Transcript_64759/g.187701 Transcript_64759/m.187701 type:complete len:227 (+) Transcript_64759:1745-2425(+)
MRRKVIFVRRVWCSFSMSAMFSANTCRRMSSKLANSGWLKRRAILLLYNDFRSSFAKMPPAYTGIMGMSDRLVQRSANVRRETSDSKTLGDSTTRMASAPSAAVQSSALVLRHTPSSQNCGAPRTRQPYSWCIEYASRSATSLQSSPQTMRTWTPDCRPPLIFRITYSRVARKHELQTPSCSRQQLRTMLPKRKMDNVSCSMFPARSRSTSRPLPMTFCTSSFPGA